MDFKNYQYKIIVINFISIRLFICGNKDPLMIHCKFNIYKYNFGAFYQILIPLIN